MRVGVPREVRSGERRVAISPETVKKLKKLGFDVAIERGAGTAAMLPDSEYESAGAELVDDAQAAWSSDVVVRITMNTKLIIKFLSFSISSSIFLYFYSYISFIFSKH